MKPTKKALLGSHRELLSLAENLDNSVDLVALTTIDGPILYINPAGMDMLCIETWSEDLHFKEFHPAWTSSFITHEVIPLAAQEGGWRGEVLFRTRTGEDFSVHQTIHVLRDEQGARNLILTIARRASEHIRPSIDITEFEDYYRLFFHRSEEAIYICEPETRQVLYGNPAFFKQSGYDRSDIPGLRIYDFVDHAREDIDKVGASFWEVEEINLGVRRWKTKQGEIKEMLVRITQVTHRDRILAVITATNVTKQMIAERNLRKSEAEYRTLVENINDGLIHVDNEDVIVFVNDRMCTLTG
ncbi:MAG: PAS domain S-box protein, partial [Bacteroidota bacterium]